MATYALYTTVDDILRMRGTTATGQNTLFSDLIKSVSRDIENACGGRHFYPLIETRYFDAPSSRELCFDEPLLALTTLTNGDGTVIASTSYDLYPYGFTPHYKLRTKVSAGIAWQPDTNGNYERAISIAGVWGYHSDYGSAWLDTLAVNAAAITTTTATTFTCATGLIQAGWLIKIDSEYMHVSAVAVGATDTITVVRGVNGSTAAAHVISSLVYRWQIPIVEMICRQAVEAYERLKNNPVGETINIGGQTFSTPKDVRAWVTQQIKNEGLGRAY